jgi:hypothetical protein
MLFCNRRLLTPSRQKNGVSPSATPSPKIDTSDDPSVDNLTDRIQTKFGLDDFNSTVSTVVQNEG